MQVTATREAFASKAGAIGGVRSACWVRGETDFAGLMALYDSGHIVNISDPEVSDALILDIDGPKPPAEKRLNAMNPAEKEAAMRQYEADRQRHETVDLPKLCNPAYLEDLSKRLGARRACLRESSSRSKFKKKLIFEIRFRRNIENNKDLECARLRKLFTEISGIAADAKMDTFTQLTFGCLRADACPPDISGWAETIQPRAGGRMRNARKTERAASDTQTMPDTPFQFIPLNMGAYNHRYGKQPREGGRLEWQVYRYSYGGSRTINAIREGKRDASLSRLYAAIVWNALFLNNAKYMPLSGGFAPFTLDDCLGTLKKTVILQFDGGEGFWAEEGDKACRQLSALWDEFAHADIGETYHALAERAGIKERDKYLPRDNHASRLFHHFKNDFAACGSYTEVRNLCGFMSEGDTRTYEALLRLCRDDKNIVKGRPGRIADYMEYLKECVQNKDGRYIVDQAHAGSKAFRNFCKINGLAYTKKH